MMWSHLGCVAPRYAEKSFAEAGHGMHFLASKGGRDGSIAIHQDANILLAKLGGGIRVEHSIAGGRQPRAHVAEGEVTISGEKLSDGDAVAIDGGSTIEIVGATGAQVLLFDLA